MTSYSSCLESEQLVRNILSQSQAPASDRNPETLRVGADCMPFPSLPQIAAKAGFRRIEIITSNGAPGATSTSLSYFIWQGIDGTKIDTCISGDETGPGADRHQDKAIWCGELPALNSYATGSVTVDSLRLAPSLREVEFLNAIKPAGLVSNT